MLKNSKNYSGLFNKLKKFLSQDIEDIVIFGSIAKGKGIPKDIDICIIFKYKIDLKKVRSINSKLGDNFHVSSLVADNFLNKKHTLAQTLLFEGISVSRGKKLSDLYSLASYSIYSYTLANLRKSNKVRFVYMLKGRKQEKGIIDNFKGSFLAPGCFIIPVEKDSEMLEIMARWNIKFKRRRALLMD